ncbi:DUF4402 domain-containing protein [Sneathiella marina]|uniref:DUF4402 domain-containing protein n=1 Tax=Sneathiella marina TaxID=2950108 RepID=A0ABY4VY52_9PROT|nr:DUF4402 domain-containing protein [Sneathiella marina]USG59760.1 DUF4402 domain-containing protein [Sneathiella marina]
MKNFPKIRGYAVIGLGLAAASLGFATSALAEERDGPISVTLVTPVTIEEVRELDFGAFLFEGHGGGDGTVTLSPAGDFIASTAATFVTIRPAVTGEIKVTGTANQAIDILLAGDVNSGPTNADGVMLSTGVPRSEEGINFTTNFDGNGELTFYVGMEILIPVGVRGEFTDGTYTVTANYQ